MSPTHKSWQTFLRTPATLGMVERDGTGRGESRKNSQLGALH